MQSLLLSLSPITIILKTNTKAHIAVLSTNFFFAVNYSVIKYVSPSLVQPFALNIIRVVVSLLLFWLLWLGSRSDAGIQRKHLGRFLLCSLTGIAINQMLFIKGLTLTSTIHASLLILCTPLLITFFAFWILKEKLTVAKIIGLVSGIGGSLLLIFARDHNGQGQSFWLGDVLIVLNAISYAVYFILVKPLMQVYPPLHVMRWVFTMGFVMMLPFCWQQFTAIQWKQFNYTHYAALAFIAVFGTFLAYYFTVYGIRHLGAGITGAYIYTQPIFAVIIATVVLNEQMTWQKIIAGLLIFLGVYLVTAVKSKAAIKTTPVV